MAANPNPTHITAGMWFFIEEWEIMEPATVYAGSWGDFKPGYHCDWDNLVAKGWIHDDYSAEMADDQVGGTDLSKFGCAVDITFPDAQSGNYTRIRKYSDRVKAAWAARDPRLKGWREVLCNCSDNDSAADGFDIPGHYERTPDDTHKWHMHFSVHRKYVNDITVYQGMLSVLKGETLEQWQAGGKVSTVIVFKYKNAYWVSRGDGASREKVVDANGNPVPLNAQSAEMNVLCNTHRVYPDSMSIAGTNDKYPSTDLTARSWSEHQVDITFGPVKSNVAPAPPGSFIPHTHTGDVSTDSGTPTK